MDQERPSKFRESKSPGLTATEFVTAGKPVSLTKMSKAVALARAIRVSEDNCTPKTTPRPLADEQFQRPVTSTQSRRSEPSRKLNKCPWESLSLLCSVDATLCDIPGRAALKLRLVASRANRMVDNHHAGLSAPPCPGSYETKKFR